MKEYKLYYHSSFRVYIFVKYKYSGGNIYSLLHIYNPLPIHFQKVEVGFNERYFSVLDGAPHFTLWISLFLSIVCCVL